MTKIARALAVAALSAACGSFQADEGSGARGDGGAANGATDGAASGGEGSSSGAPTSCETATPELAEEFTAPNFAVAWTASASGAVSEVDTASSLSPPQSMRTRKLAAGDTAAFSFLHRVVPGSAKEICVDFAVVIDSFGSTQDDDALTLFGLGLEPPASSGLKDYELSLVLESGGNAAIVEHANGTTGQPDVVNQRHPITGSAYWPTATWTQLALRISLESAKVELRAAGNVLVRANLQSPPSTAATDVRVGVVHEANAMGSAWTVHHDNVFVRFGR